MSDHAPMSIWAKQINCTWYIWGEGTGWKGGPAMNGERVRFECVVCNSQVINKMLGWKNKRY